MFSGTDGPDSPFAEDRQAARLELSRDKILEQCRATLREGGRPGLVVDAIDTLSRARDKADIGLVAPLVSDIEPSVAVAAMEALRRYGKEALTALEALPSSAIDEPTRKKVREQLLQDHIYACCQRDMAVNPMQLDYPARLDELYSIGQDLDTLMLAQLREASAELRQDLSGQYFSRRYYYGYVPDAEPMFVEYGALVIAALAAKRPEQLKRETEGLVERNLPPSFNYYYGQVRQPATRELCCFLARNGISEPILKMVSDMEMSMRFQQEPGYVAGVHIDIAACMLSAGAKDLPSADPKRPRGPFELATIVEHIDTAISLAGASGLPVASYSRYLKARLLMLQGDDGGALRELEESVEASGEPLLLLGVDAAFAKLAPERRFQTLLQYTALVARRVDESARPYKPGNR